VSQQQNQSVEADSGYSFQKWLWLSAAQYVPKLRYFRSGAPKQQEYQLIVTVLSVVFTTEANPVGKPLTGSISCASSKGNGCCNWYQSIPLGFCALQQKYVK
jgi:hypothetical protein